MGSLVTGIILVVVLLLLPVMLFFGLVGLALFLWCWKRIGPYLVNFGRWTADWRNLLPCGCMMVVGYLLLVLATSFLLPGAFRTIGIILLALVGVVCGIFAGIVFSVRAMQWFWASYRRFFWRWVNEAWDFIWIRSPRESLRYRPGRRGSPRPPGAVEPSLAEPALAGRQVRRKQSRLAAFWALMLGKPSRPTKSAAGPQPGIANLQPAKEAAPGKRSWFGTFWALMLGKSQPRRQQQARPTRVRTTDQTLGPSGGLAATAGTESRVSETASSAVRPVRREKPPKRSWFGSFWAMMMGRPSKSTKPKPRPAKAETTDQTSGSPDNVAATAKTGASTSVAETATSPESGKAKPAKQGGFGRIWTSMVRGVTFVVGLVILGVLVVGRKIGGGIEWIRVRLNLD